MIRRCRIELRLAAIRLTSRAILNVAIEKSFNAGERRLSTVTEFSEVLGR